MWLSIEVLVEADELFCLHSGGAVSGEGELNKDIDVDSQEYMRSRAIQLSKRVLVRRLNARCASRSL